MTLIEVGPSGNQLLFTCRVSSDIKYQSLVEEKVAWQLMKALHADAPCEMYLSKELVSGENLLPVKGSLYLETYEVSNEPDVRMVWTGGNGNLLQVTWVDKKAMLVRYKELWEKFCETGHGA